jgi:hypothetical protein
MYLSVRPKLGAFFRFLTIFIIAAHFFQLDRSIPKIIEDSGRRRASLCRFNDTPTDANVLNIG